MALSWDGVEKRKQNRDDDGEESWLQNRKLVLSYLETIDRRLDEIAKVNIELKISIAHLQERSGFFGFLGGLIPAVVAMIYFFFQK